MQKPIDTHTHLFSHKFQHDREEVMARAQEACRAVMLPNIDSATIQPMNDLAAAYPDFAFPMIGLHPTHVPADPERELQTIHAALMSGGYYGIGETGLDLHWDTKTLPQQQHSLRRHCEWARDSNLPIILHARGAFDETATIIEEQQDGRLRGIFHCFTEGEAEARRAIDAGFLLGLGGVLTFKKSDALRAAVRDLPKEHIVLETDSPYLAPQGHRGRRNESAYITEVAETLTEVWGLSVEETVAITNTNAERLFELELAGA